MVGIYFFEISLKVLFTTILLVNLFIFKFDKLYKGLFVTLQFGKMGIFAEVMNIQDKPYLLLILPPFMALYWDDFYREDQIGKAAMGAITMVSLYN